MLRRVCFKCYNLPMYICSELDTKQYGNFAWTEIFTVLWKINRIKISFLDFLQFVCVNLNCLKWYLQNFESKIHNANVSLRNNNKMIMKTKQNKIKKMYLCRGNGKFIVMIHPVIQETIPSSSQGYPNPYKWSDINRIKCIINTTA